MTCRFSSIPRSFLLVVLASIGTGVGYGEESRVTLAESFPTNWLLRRPVPSYQNYAFDTYSNYLQTTFPQAEQPGLVENFYPRALYDGFGDHVVTGYDLFTWYERRQPELQWGSSISKNEGTWTEAFAYVAIARDGYGDWNYSATVGDVLTARFTPLTLSLVDFSGFRFDLATPHLKLTTLASRIQRPYAPRGFDYVRKTRFHIGPTMYAADSSLLLGGRLQTDIGNASLGLNLANLHVYDSGRPDNSIKGILRPGHPLVDWVVVRFADDSPRDGRGGAVIQDILLIVNGEPRRDLVPQVIRHRANATTQVGTYSVISGRFLPNPYFTHTPGYTTFYRGRDEIPLYADYRYRLDHEAGVDVSRQTNVSRLLSTFTVESAAELQRADGDEQLVYLFDISQEPYLESVEVEAMLANDYRVEVANLREANIRGKGYEERFKSEFYRTVLRARDNVQDLSNLKRVRFRIGEDTAIFTYSADLNLQVVGLELNGEYARSSVYRRFPAETANLPSFDESPRFADRGSAYFINATRWTANWRFGGEYFAMNPEFTTTMRSFVAREGGVSDHRSTIKGLSNETIYWDLVQDNEDGDRFPDKRTGWTTGTWYINDCNPPCGIDPDGVYIAQDSDNDGYPDINRNGDALPDYLEPFLMYEVEPNDYTYGFDRNNNDEPDQREDDWDPDHPYDADQRGYHVFAQANLSQRWTLALGRHDVEQLAGSGMNLTTYTLLTYRSEGPDRVRRLFFENSFRRVRDNIPDEYNIFTENRRFTGEYRFYVHSAYRGNRSFHSRPRQDQLLYENSYVNETYLENWLQPWSTLNLVQKLRLRVNWQRGGRLSGGFIGRERRLDHSTFVNRLDYTWNLGKLSIQPKFKFQMIRFVDREQDRTIRFEYETLPILLFEMPLMAHTTARLGIQGWGSLPYRFDNRQRGLDSFRRRTAIASLTNRSRYFGYELYTVVGLIRDAKEFDAAARLAGNFDTLSIFVRTLVGFPDHSNLLL